jgi:hypothetical protein
VEEDDTQADYLFEQGTVPGYPNELNPSYFFSAPSAGGSDPAIWTISTNGTVTSPVTVTVTSHDFGGVAELRATGTLYGSTYDVDVVTDPVSLKAVTPPSDSQYGLCGTDFATHPFASLPVDQDCDGIADWWEDVNSPASGPGSPGNPLPTGVVRGQIRHDQAIQIPHLPPTWDGEPGYNGTTVGDGYSVADEYRGFHYIQDAVDTSDANNPDGVVQWTRTDPSNTQDVFFWDSAVTQPDGQDPCSSPEDAGGDLVAGSQFHANCITTGLRSLLANQPVTAAGVQFMALRRVDAAQANANSLAAPVGVEDPSQGVSIFNKNSLTQKNAPAGSQLSLGGFALVYGVNARLNPVAMCAPGGSLDATFGLSTADPIFAGGFANNGISFINIALDRIVACSLLAKQNANDPGYPQGTFLSQVVAHETGHRFGLFHTYKPVTYGGQVPNPVSYAALTARNYLLDQSGDMYMRFDLTGVSDGLQNPDYQQLERLSDGSFIVCNQVAQNLPPFPDSVWTLSGCKIRGEAVGPVPIQNLPQLQGPVPAPGACIASHATKDAPSEVAASRAQPFFIVDTAGIVVGARGRGTGTLNMMGYEPMFNRTYFGTSYGFDPVCELPYFNPTPAPEN